MYNICPFCKKSIEMIRDWPAKYFVFRRHSISEGVECEGTGYPLYEARREAKMRLTPVAADLAYCPSCKEILSSTGQCLNGDCPA